jgi:hypothetical protein
MCSSEIVVAASRINASVPAGPDASVGARGGTQASETRTTASVHRARERLNTISPTVRAN